MSRLYAPPDREDRQAVAPGSHPGAAALKVSSRTGA